MSYALLTIGFLGFFVSIIFMIVRAVKKRFQKKFFFLPLICIILFLIGGLTLPSIQATTPEQITLSLSEEKDTYDVNTTIPIHISVEPQEASISELTYESDKNGLSISNSEIHTGSREDTYHISVKAGSVKSNTLTIHVENQALQAALLSARNEISTQGTAIATQLSTTTTNVKAAAEEAARKQAELEAQQKAAEEAARQQIEREAQQKAAEEAAKKEAQQKASSQNSNNSSSSQTQQNVGSTVYWVDSGEVYHSTPNCSTLSRSKNIHSGSVAQSGKPRRCKVCY